MGAISQQFGAAFRDFVTDGVSSSGAHDVVKSEVRAIGGLIEQAIGTMGLGSTLSVAYGTRAELNADLAHAAASVALVYNDPTVANNDLYVKVGASGTGSWTLTTALRDAIDGAAGSLIADAEAARDLAKRYRDEAGLYAAETEGHAGDAESASSLAQMAALTAPTVYATKAAGLAAVGEGGTFWSNEDEPLALYRDVSGVATKLASAVTSADILLTTQIVLFGNSIGEAPLPLTPALTALVSSLNTAGGRYSGNNLGRGGELMRQISRRCAAYFNTGARPKYVIFVGLSQNSFRKIDEDGNDLATVKVQAQAAIDAAHDAGAVVIVCTDTPATGYVDPNPTYSWNSAKQTALEDFNDWLANDANNIDVLVDVFTEFNNGGALKAIYDSGDHLHPNQAGQDKIAEMIEAAATFTMDGALKDRIEGRNSKNDQDVSTAGAPSFEGITVGAQRGGGDGDPVFSATQNDGLAGWGFGIPWQGGSMAADLDWRVKFVWRSALNYEKACGIEPVALGAGTAHLDFFQRGGIGETYERVGRITYDKRWMFGAMVDAGADVSIGAIGSTIQLEMDFSGGEFAENAVDRDDNTFVTRRYRASIHQFGVGTGTQPGPIFSVNGLEVPLIAGGAADSFPPNCHITVDGLFRRASLPSAPSLGSALPEDGSATAAAMATMLNKMRTLLIGLGYATT